MYINSFLLIGCPILDPNVRNTIYLAVRARHLTLQMNLSPNLLYKLPFFDVHQILFLFSNEYYRRQQLPVQAAGLICRKGTSG